MFLQLLQCCMVLQKQLDFCQFRPKRKNESSKHSNCQNDDAEEKNNNIIIIFNFVYFQIIISDISIFYKMSALLYNPHSYLVILKPAINISFTFCHLLSSCNHCTSMRWKAIVVYCVRCQMAGDFLALSMILNSGNILAVLDNIRYLNQSSFFCYSFISFVLFGSCTSAKSIIDSPHKVDLVYRV